MLDDVIVNIVNRIRVQAALCKLEIGQSPAQTRTSRLARMPSTPRIVLVGMALNIIGAVLTVYNLHVLATTSCTPQDLSAFVDLPFNLETTAAKKLSKLHIKSKLDALKRPREVSKSTQAYDLVFWYDTTNSSEAVVFDDLVVVRKISKKHNPALGEMEQILRVDFQECTDHCHMMLASNVSESEASFRQRRGYQQNQGTSLLFYKQKSSNDQFSSRLFNMFQNTPIKSVTVWDDSLQQDIPLPYGPKDMRLLFCDEGACPVECEENKNPNLLYPYMRDPHDKLCKSTDPRNLPPLVPQYRENQGVCRCESTCFTPEAIQPNSTWPWKSEKERNQYLPYHGDRKMFEDKAREHHYCKVQRTTNQTEFTYKPRFLCPGRPDSNRLPCPAFGDSDFHLYYIPTAKLIFCGVPKVGITEWIKFFRYVAGAGDYLSLPHFKTDKDAFMVKALPFAKAEELMNNPEWTKAVFFRDPLERLLSAYMDKIVRGDYTQRVFNIGDDTLPWKERFRINFTDFVDLVTDMSTSDDCTDPKGLKACTDPHFKPQTMICGLDHLLPKFDFIGSFDHIAEHSKLLLERTGMWEEFGAKFDDGMETLQKQNENRHPCYLPKPERTQEEKILGFNQRGTTKSGSYQHSTDSQSRFKEFYTPEVVAKVRAAYKMDFAVWDEIGDKSRPVDDIPNGKDLKVVRDFCSATS